MVWYKLCNLKTNWKAALETFYRSCFDGLSKALDCIPQNLLIAKFDAYGFSFETLIFLNSYLSDCKQCVKIENICSDFLNILSGMPQGYIL